MKKIVISFKCDADLRHQVNIACANLNIKKSDFYIQAIKNHLQKKTSK